MVISSIFFGCSQIGTLEIPGKSIIVKSGQVFENIFIIRGLSSIFLLFPQTLSWNLIIISFTFERSVIFSFLFLSL